MAEKVIKHSDLIEDNVFQPTINQAKLLLAELDKIEKSLKSVAYVTGKSLKTPNDAKGLEDFNNATKKIDDTQKGILETERQRLKVQTALKVERQNLNKQLVIEAKLASETTSAFEKSRIELKKLNDQLLNLKSGSKEFNEVAKRAGKLKDEINDAKDAVKAFANESKATTAKTLFGQVFSDIKDLDFKGAADKAKILSEVVKTITFADVAKGVKNLGSTLLDLGKAIFLNPLFALAGAIVAIAIAVKQEYDAFSAGEEIFDKYNKQIAEMADNHKEAAKQLRDLKLANQELAGELKSFDAERIKAGNTFKDKVINLKLAQFKKTREINAEIAENDKMTLLEGSLGPAGLALQLKRIIANEKRRKILLLELDKKTQQEIADQSAIYREQLKTAQINERIETKKTKEEIDKKDIALRKKLLKEELDAIKDAEQEAITEAKRQIDANEKALQEANKNRIFSTREGSKERLEAEINQITTEADFRINNESHTQIEIFNIQAEAAKKIQDLKDANAARDKERRDKAIDEQFKQIKQLESAVAEGLNARSDKQQEALKKEIDNRDKAIQTQQQRAQAGLENTLAFEQQKRDESALALKESEEKEAKRKEAQELGEVFLEFLKLYAKDGNKNAASKALADTLVAKGLKRAIAGFYEGTEDTGKATGALDSKGGRLAILHDNERVLTKEQNKMIGNISNDELAQLAYKSNLETQGREIKVGSDSIVVNLLSKKLTSLENAIKNKREISINWDSYGARVEEVVEKGMKTVYKKVTTGKRRI